MKSQSIPVLPVLPVSASSLSCSTLSWYSELQLQRPPETPEQSPRRGSLRALQLHVLTSLSEETQFSTRPGKQQTS